MEKKWDTVIPPDLKRLFVSGTFMSSGHERVNQYPHQCNYAISFSRKISSVFSLDNGKAIPLQAWTGPEVSRRLRLPDFKTIGT